MLEDRRIKEINVKGLHDQFDFSIELNPGLNILYGKNGRGKTTLLHLLANALELDFERFNFIRFHQISIKTFNGDELLISRSDLASSPNVKLNGEATSYDGKNSSLSAVEVTSLREALGGRPTYLPAFRSVLEKTRSESHAYYRPSERREASIDELIELEHKALTEISARESLTPIEYRQLRDEAYVTAQKTVQCRQWFGNFVPVVRYPSLGDVEEGLTDEWRTAHLDVTRREQRMFEETFVKVFRVISGLDIDKVSSQESNESLLASIHEQLKDEESQFYEGESNEIYNSLLEATRNGNHLANTEKSVDSSILQLYREVLISRNKERRSSFEKIRDFTASVNKFLDRKTLQIGQVSDRSRARVRTAVSVGTETGQSYGLSALSSGERQILTMLFSASRSKFSSGIFLIDEPELSLHIDWQRIILRELNAQSSDRQIIACTHSPEVGADHISVTQDFEPTSSKERQHTLFSEEDF
ncbi:AAA family ATPase [Stutzerimonas stutzeri]|uniref:AAA family ATPase n=1 Tax=Stutzerimonas stutzeri TaxID=316 RepID=UPI0009B74E79|nr:AAA family ATPase [Stutzerimonas stutzeri]